MPRCHCIVHEFFPTPGGLQESLTRIALLINGIAGCASRIYVRDETNQYGRTATIPGLDVFLVGAERVRLMEPIQPLTADRFRSDYLILRREIERSIRDNPGERQVVLSFGVTQSGFLGQQVAAALGLTHLACFRGTDFSRDCFDPVAQSAIRDTVQRADGIVTTNTEQLRFLKTLFGARLKAETIYNSVELPRGRWRHHAGGCVRLVADCGFAFKKGTHILLRACAALLGEGLPIELSVCGPTADYEQAYWDQTRRDWEARFGTHVRFQGVIEQLKVEELLAGGDLYCSATLGEGCSLARSRALVFGMPMVSTRCGELADLAPNASHIFLAEPGDEAGYLAALRSACLGLLADTIAVDEHSVERAQSVLSRETERAAWRNLLTGIADRGAAKSTRGQFRVVMYAHDGRGLGHLRRLCRLAKTLQGACAVLLITGHRAASWLVPDTCEFVHLPSLDSLDPRLSGQWGLLLFWDAGRREGLRVRQAAVESLVESFAPDAIVVDYLPAGKDDEMYSILDRFSGLRYLILRGVLDDVAAVHRDILNPAGLHLIEKRYDRILVMADRKIVDVVGEYRMHRKIADKVFYSGYAADPMDDSQCRQVRRERDIPDTAQWVVCSAGGGKEGEDLIEHCHAMAAEFPEVFFDIVVGPRSRSALATGATTVSTNRVRLSRERLDLPLLHGACDVLICRGGYNSLVEGAVGRARIIVVPTSGDYEQFTHATRLASFLPIAVIEDVRQLDTRLRDGLAAGARETAAVALNFNGAESATQLILQDLHRRRNGAGTAAAGAQGNIDA